MTKQEVIHTETDAQEVPSIPVHKNIAMALARAQMQMGKALKSESNKHFNTKYADLSDVMDACLPALNQNGIAVIQPTGEDDGQRFVRTVLVHGDSGETLECRTPLIVGKNDMQGYGSAVTYGRRYGLMCMAGIAPDDDDGNAAAAAAPASSRTERGPDRAAQDSHDADVARAIASIQRETDLQSLGAFWADLRSTARPVAADQRVIAAKEARKTALQKPADDLGGDNIPF
ncbi:ERF family protein [Profundibacterium mesophilum]|uniref:ERF family protein n=1 Tax=Profundibacterium mesophilum KAUST100406-0324 TaxID=1037889 RepID=A0A921NT80_9RHOB|nr:ERF family protein [Profundibacterium mesophilum]KAF0675100.1 ERF family protein [Profundibacterium mesophilum KAUST100406-0324]